MRLAVKGSQSEAAVVCAWYLAHPGMPRHSRLGLAHLEDGESSLSHPLPPSLLEARGAWNVSSRPKPTRVPPMTHLARQGLRENMAVAAAAQPQPQPRLPDPTGSPAGARARSPPDPVPRAPSPDPVPTAPSRRPLAEPRQRMPETSARDAGGCSSPHPNRCCRCRCCRPGRPRLRCKLLQQTTL